MFKIYLNEITKIKTKIYEVSRQKVMLDFDLADLYEVENRDLNKLQAVNYNLNLRSNKCK